MSLVENGAGSNNFNSIATSFVFVDTASWLALLVLMFSGSLKLIHSFRVYFANRNTQSAERDKVLLLITVSWTLGALVGNDCQLLPHENM